MTDAHFNTAHLDVERLLADWRWLCPKPVTLVARNVYGDLYLRAEDGTYQLDVGIGRLAKVADSLEHFLVLCESGEKREEWFAESQERTAAQRVLAPGATECIGFSMPVVFKESGPPNTPYVIDIYEHVGFLGDLHRQIADLPNGAKVRLIVKR
jgi:hypothetical protein